MSFCPQAKGAGPFLQTESDISRGLCLLPSRMDCFSDRAPRGNATHPAPPPPPAKVTCWAKQKPDRWFALELGRRVAAHF